MKRLLILAVAAVLSCPAMADYSWYDEWLAENPGTINYADSRYYDSSVYASPGLWQDNGYDFLISGVPLDRNQVVVGGGNFSTAGYVEIGLGENGTPINNAMVFFRTDGGYAIPATSFTVLVSTTGNADTDFAPVTLIGDIQYFLSDKFGTGVLNDWYWDDNNPNTHLFFMDGAAYDFELVQHATYLRITGVQPPPSWTPYATQIAVHNVPPVPEPATMSVLALGGLALLRRRR